MAGGSPEGKSGGGSPYQSMTSRGLAGSPLHAARLPTDALGLAMTVAQGSLGRRPRARPRLGIILGVVQFAGWVQKNRSISGTISGPLGWTGFGQGQAVTPGRFRPASAL